MFKFSIAIVVATAALLQPVHSLAVTYRVDFTAHVTSYGGGSTGDGLSFFDLDVGDIFSGSYYYSDTPSNVYSSNGLSTQQNMNYSDEQSFARINLAGEEVLINSAEPDVNSAANISRSNNAISNLYEAVWDEDTPPPGCVDYPNFPAGFYGCTASDHYRVTYYEGVPSSNDYLHFIISGGDSWDPDTPAHDFLTGVGATDMPDLSLLDSGTGPMSFYLNVKRESGSVVITGNIDSLTFTEVPLPAAAYLFGVALLGLVGLKRRH